MGNKNKKYKVSSRFRSVANSVLNGVPEHTTAVLGLSLATFYKNAQDDNKKPVILLAEKGSGRGHIALNDDPHLRTDRTLVIEVRDLATNVVYQMKIAGRDKNGKPTSFDRRITSDFIAAAVEDFVESH